MGNKFLGTNKTHDRRFVEDLSDSTGLYITETKEFIKLKYITHRHESSYRNGLSFVKTPFTKAELKYISTLDKNKIYEDKFGEVDYTNINEDGLNALLCAIVERAVEDYKWSYRYLKKILRKNQEDLDEYERYQKNQAEYYYSDCKTFFDGEWCSLISPVHPENIKDKLYSDEEKFYKRCEKKDKELKGEL